MRWTLALCTLIMLLGSACVEGVSPEADKGKMIPIVPPANAEGLVRAGESPVEARDRLIRRLSERAPHLLDEFTLKSLRGEHNAWLVGVDESDARFAPLIGEIIALTSMIQVQDRERRRS